MCVQNVLFSHLRYFKGDFMKKNTKKWQKVSTLWHHYEVETMRKNIFCIIYEILIQYIWRFVIRLFSYWMIYRVKICKRKFFYQFGFFFYHISLYKIGVKMDNFENLKKYQKNSLHIGCCLILWFWCHEGATLQK